MPKTNFNQHIIIDALPSKVWKVLTHADYVSQYFWDEEVSADWKEGSAIYKCNEEKGVIEEITPGVSIKFRLLEEEQILQFSYSLIPDANGVELKLDCQGLSDSEEAYFLRMQQFKLILQKIKWLAEYG